MLNTIRGILKVSRHFICVALTCSHLANIRSRGDLQAKRIPRVSTEDPGILSTQSDTVQRDQVEMRTVSANWACSAVRGALRNQMSRDH